MLIEQLNSLIKAEVEALGFILWGIEIDHSSSHAGSMTLRVFIDHEQGISVDDCQRVSQTVSTILDVEDPIDRTYTLEVSSPGVNRRVFNALQASALIGFEVKTRLVRADEMTDRRNLKGKITAVENNNVTLDTEVGEIVFDFGQVEHMRVVAKL